MLTIQTYDNALKESNITSISDYETKFIDSPYYGKLLSNNHQWVGISLSIDKKNDGNDLNRRVSAIEKIKSILKSAPNMFNILYLETPLFTMKWMHLQNKNLTLLLPLAFLLLLFISWLFLQQWRAVMIIIIPTLVNLGLVPILIVLLGHHVTIINITLFILVLVITVADGIHMLSYWERYVINKSKHPIADTIRATWLPCFITSITTAVGFGSFASSDIIPLNQYGLQSFLVMIFGYIIVMTTVPFLLPINSTKNQLQKRYRIIPKNSIRNFTTNYIQFKKILAISLIFTIAFSQALWKSETETSFISVFFNKRASRAKKCKIN